PNTSETLSLHDALPIYLTKLVYHLQSQGILSLGTVKNVLGGEIFTLTHGTGLVGTAQKLLGQPDNAGGGGILLQAAVLAAAAGEDRKSTRLNSSHVSIS